ncbi:phage tail sheath protein [Stenotrophomonas maltophilia]|uniref:phage tail sheath protein n=1 Tax=Stenotrophomonas TaxID=40323 RepID=UPI000468D6F7|nr:MULTISPECIES: phage tail sheath protein [Stenotrophomonas]OMP40122.1 phage tail protein [Stenotrophomonas sp. KAs 5-3]AIL07473.1 phage tail sheath family protein [Stenotrophomonas maltophilia]OMO42145.1 phage tail protein [Stenotrophomonas sp. MB339]OOD20066.1 phage tail protein [Stenotrophomonas maltophilia]QQA82841.1 phage tail sheath protein [Stenotrophomonas maltophilia]
MAQDYHHGVRVIELDGGIRPIRTVATAIVGIVCTSQDADDATFPIDTPVLLTDVRGAIAKAGTKGTLAGVLAAIADQSNPVTVVVRVDEGEDAATTTSNVIGTVAGGRYTGLQALLVAESKLGVKPRIIAAPGLDTEAVTTSIASICKKLRAIAYVGVGEAKTVSEILLYRKKFGDRELMMMWPDFLTWDTTAKKEAVSYATARALGLRALIDQQTGWHKTLSNVKVQGVTGLSADVTWDLQDPQTDAGLLNAAAVTTLINSQGYRFWGSRTCSDDPLFAFESATRTAQILADTIAEAQMIYIDKPLHPSLVKDMIETINAKFRELKNGGYVIDANAWYDEAANLPTQLSSGQLAIDYDYTPVPPLESLNLRQRITDRYFADFATRITA